MKRTRPQLTINKPPKMIERLTSKLKETKAREIIEKVAETLKDPKNWNPAPSMTQEVFDAAKSRLEERAAKVPSLKTAIEALFVGISFRSGKEEAIRRVSDFVTVGERRTIADCEKNSTAWIQDKHAEIRARDSEIAKLQRAIRLLNNHRASEVIAACSDPYADQVEVGERR